MTVRGEREIPDLLRTFHARARGMSARAQAARVGRTPRHSGAAWSVAVSMRPAKKIGCYHYTFLSSGCTRPARSCRQLVVRVMMVQVTDGRAGTCSTDERSSFGLGGLHAARFRRTLEARPPLVDVLYNTCTEYALRYSHVSLCASKKVGAHRVLAGDLGRRTGRSESYPRSSLGVPR